MGQKKSNGTRKIGRGNLEKKSCMMKKIVPQSCKAVPLVIWSSDSLSGKNAIFFCRQFQNQALGIGIAVQYIACFSCASACFASAGCFCPAISCANQRVFVLFPASYVITNIYTYIYEPTCKYIQMWWQVDGRSVGKIWGNINYGEGC